MINYVNTDNERQLELLKLLKALAEPIRLHIVQSLIQDEVGAERHCTSFGLAVSKATRSHHFKVLREAGIISQVDRGNSAMAQLRRDDLENRFPGLLAIIANPPQEKREN